MGFHPVIKSLFAIDTSSKKKNHFFPNRVSLVYQSHSRTDPIPAGVGQHETDPIEFCFEFYISFWNFLSHCFFYFNFCIFMIYFLKHR